MWYIPSYAQETTVRRIILYSVLFTVFKDAALLMIEANNK
nr:MAG TPA: hypothetical protein [Caudoviricetes sp.]